jgi:DNA-binding CsgD family transcriptional regulator
MHSDVNADPASPQRVSVIDSAFAEVVGPADRDEGLDRPGAEQVMQVLADLALCVTNGNYSSDHREGVILDTVVGTTRCLLIAHKPSRFVSLSPREQQVAMMVARGRTNQAIAAALDISVWTVSTHIRRIFAKLAVSSRAEMVTHLLENRDVILPADPRR